MNRTNQPLVMALAIAAAFSACATAQAQTASPLSSSGTVVLTAQRLPQSVQDVLADVVVLGPEDIARAGASTVTELLQRQRGVEISRNGGPGTTASVFLRGASNAQSVVLVDGVRVGSATMGGASWAALPLAEIERIEIVYGSLSTLYGADAMGGVIQIFTKEGQGPLAAQADLGVGSYGLKSIYAGVSGADGGWRYALRAGHEEADGFSATKPAAGKYSYNPDKDGYNSDHASGRVSVKLDGEHEVGGQFLYSHLNAQFDAGPGFDDRAVQELLTLSVYGRARLTPVWTSTLQLSSMEDKGSTIASYGNSFANTRETILSWNNAWRVGQDTVQWIAESRRERVLADQQGVSGSRNTEALGAAYVYKEGAQRASVGVRYDRSGQFGGHTTGSVSYGYQLDQAWRFEAGLGSSFRAPTFNELYFPGYGIAQNRPEQARNGELGVSYEAEGSQLSARVYRNRATDLLVYTPVCPIETQSHPWGCAYNVNQATMTGLSLGGQTRLGALSLKASLDAQNPEDDTSNKQLARRAKLHGAVSAEYQWGTTRFGAETLFSDQRFDDAANLKRLPGYALLNLSVQHQLAPGWTLLARWNNVLDKDYELAKNYANAGSNFFLGVKYGM